MTDINLDNVCKKGNTLLWDLVQDEDAVRLGLRLGGRGIISVLSEGVNEAILNLLTLRTQSNLGFQRG